MASDDSAAATALLTEHLGYTPLSLVDDVFNSINTIIYLSIEKLETGLASLPPERLGFKGSKSTIGDQQVNDEYADAKQEIEEGLHQLETLLTSSADKRFDAFEIYTLRNILSVPPDLVNWIRLSHHEGISLSHADAPSLDTIEELRRKLAASRMVSQSLASEHGRNETILAQLKGILDADSKDETLPNMSFMPGKLPQQPFSGQLPLTTNTTFALSQLPALKTTLTELRARLATLRGMQLGLDTAKDERREERRQYIEQRTRSHLERNGRLAASNKGPLTGRVTDPAEVDALEKAANMFNPP
ncbi:hypothetical protein LTR05_000366 [Lithohypha guttulata]|uniref:Uncharacterized protein n=1 Tax=Lithohypha guttulata TaxID=1690604 RepID=A0AAN7YKA1_9EURO|nr:hypothetical protein LTR05_000366 [Lithohypha guttulata]